MAAFVQMTSWDTDFLRDHTTIQINNEYTGYMSAFMKTLLAAINDPVDKIDSCQAFTAKYSE
eukprot:11045807-Alexandrium_andersonii.AAC.1